MIKRLIAAILIILSLGSAFWGYSQLSEARDAEQTASDARGGKSAFEREPEIKARLIETADRNSVELRAAARNAFIGAAVLGIAGVALLVVGKDKRAFNAGSA
jgi:hypothetical protein